MYVLFYQTSAVSVYRLLTIGSVEIDMMEKQISKKKLERMAISGGNFAKPGQRREGTDFTVDTLKKLLTDDVNLLERADSDTHDKVNITLNSHSLYTPLYSSLSPSLCISSLVGMKL